MLCEPIYDLPQQFDIGALRDSDKPYFAAQEVQLKTETAKKSLSQLSTEYRILPTFSHHSDGEHLRSTLSLKSNEYLLCKWHQFLENVPAHYVDIYLYADYRKKAQVAGRRQLNGQFYGVDNKLAPIPYFPDPRQYDIVFLNKCPRLQTKSK